MLQFFDTLTDVSGNALLGATLAVTAYPGGGAAAIYSTNGTANPIANSTVSADITGQVSFFLPDGAYIFTYSYKSTVYKTRSPVMIQDPMGLVAVADSGAANAYVITDSRLPAQLYTGLKVEMLAAHTNTSSSTFNLNATGAKSIKQPGGEGIAAGMIQANGLVRFEWDGTQWELIGSQGQKTSNVTSYGADPSGTNDSLAAFNAASAVETDYVFVPPGTYKLSANTNAGMWEIGAGVTFTGAGQLFGQVIERFNAASNYVLRIITNAQTTGQLIPFNIEAGFYQTATPSAADQFAQATEAWTPTSSAVVWNGDLTGTYGSFSHFGSGGASAIYGGSFEGFNSGSATATLVVGVNGNADNGGVAAGVPTQTPSNNGLATNLRGVSGSCTNSSSGLVANAAVLFANAVLKIGSGAITNVYGLAISDQTAGVNNFAIFTGAGLNSFGDALKITGHTNLPASAGATSLLVAGGFASVTGRLYCGDGSGYQLQFAKRTGSVDTILGWVSDTGIIVGNRLLSQSDPIGYTVGAGGAVVQATSKSTAVTLNASSGTITTNNAALAAGAIAAFNFNNSKLMPTSVIVFTVQSGAGITNGAYTVFCDNMQNGVCNVNIKNNSGGSLSEAVIINFAVIVGSAS